MKASLPEVSVVVPVYNGEATIAACLDSLLAMDYPRERFEIVVVDNASTDGTADVLSGYANEITRLEEAVRGPSAARNRGVRAATTDTIAFTDADCVVDAAWLRNLVLPLCDADVGIVGGRIRSRTPCNAIERFGEHIHDHRLALTTFNPPYAISMNWASPRHVLMEAGLFDESYLRCEDVELSLKIHRLGYRLTYQETAVIRHQNERSYVGLFREGYQHGVWSVKSLKDNSGFYTRTGHGRINLQSYRRIASSIRRAWLGESRTQSLCSAVFDIGKKFGKVTGSLRFGYLDL